MIIPIAGLILTFIACYELIQLIIEHNNLANFETWIFFKWIFKTFVAVMLITNTFNIKIHHEVSKHEDENVGVEAAHKMEGAVEAGSHTASYVKYSGKMRAYKKADKLEKKSDYRSPPCR